MILQPTSEHGSINKYVTHVCVHGWYHRYWLIIPTWEELLVVYLIRYIHCLCQWGTVSDLQHHFPIHQWYYTQDPMISYIYVDLCMKACYFHHQRNNKMEKFHWTMPSSKLITNWWLTCWWNNYTLLYNIFISLIDLLW